jgi:hypothetical protein
MFTNTMKMIMTPVADSIAELMIVNAECDAQNLAMPDLTEVALVVKRQAETLIIVGREMLDHGDDILKQQMPKALADGNHKDF